MPLLEYREVQYDGVHCHLAVEWFPPGTVVLRISGSDIGEFGEAPMQALSGWLADHQPVDFFIDARDVRVASIEVSGEWARWLGIHKQDLRTVTMLTGSRFVNMTAEFVRRFADLTQMKICTEPAVFDRALAEAMQS